MPRRPASANPSPGMPPDAASRRRATLRTAWIVAAIALAVYLAFLLSGMLPS